MQKKIEYLKTLPGKRVAVGVLLFDKNDKLLVLKPGYKGQWTIPGGVVDKHESPVEAALREAREEIGIDIVLNRCLAVDFTKNELGDYLSESLQIIFLGKSLSESDMKSIRIDNDEIIDYKFVDFDVALSILGKNISKRVGSINRDFLTFVFMENGEPVV